MSYTESDVLENIFEGIKGDRGLINVINLLIGWYEKEKALAEINNCDTTQLDNRIKLLKRKIK